MRGFAMVVFVRAVFVRAAFIGAVLLAAGVASGNDDPAFDPVVVELSGECSSATFRGDLATTPEQHKRGLMFVKSLKPDYAMVFDFSAPRPGKMWMKNTFVSLDMLFADETMKVTHIVENTEPLSEAIISSPGPVRYVIELAAGTVKRLDIRPGDRFSLKMQ